jgi:Co/Zn/Cd efflux system component
LSRWPELWRSGSCSVGGCRADWHRRIHKICSRNDAIGNLAVLLATLGVFGTSTGWPDVIVAAIMGGLAGGWQIVRQARGELRCGRARRLTVAAE